MSVPSARALSICVLLGGCGSDQSDAPPTFYQDIAPLAAEHCSSCHQSGGVAWAWPEQPRLAQANARILADAVSSGRMPPWLPADDCAEFVAERRLTAKQIRVFEDWAEADAPLGDPTDPIPIEPQRLADPDLDLALPAYAPAGGDDFRCFVVDPALAQRELISGVDVTAARGSSVHHVVALRMEREASATLGADALREGWACGDLPHVPFDELLGAWASGAPPLELPSGTGLALDAEHVVLLQFHYFGGAGVPVEGSLSLRYAAATAAEARIVPVTDYDFSIPPHSSDVTKTSTRPGSLYTTGPARVLGVMPHMHALGQRFALERERDGDKTCLMRVPSWDPLYQELYFLKGPGVGLLPTDNLELGCTWDNPTDREVGWGSGAGDEMCVAYLYLLAGGG